MTDKPESNPLMQTFQRIVSLQNAEEASKRLAPMREGRNEIIRFFKSARIEHAVLILAGGGLAVTGLAQTFKNNVPAGLVLRLLGGLEATQAYHHLLGLILIGLAIYHLVRVLDSYFVKRQDGSMLPGISDLEHFFQILKLNLGLSKILPQYNRYSIDEKFIYWLTLTTCAGLIATGLVMWYPSIVTQVLPGWIFAFSAVFHKWLAFLLVGVTILLHGYQVFLRRMNFSIFSGRMSHAVMEEDHPVELAWLETAAAHADAENWPQVVMYKVEILQAHAPARQVEIKELKRGSNGEDDVQKVVDFQLVDVVKEEIADARTLEPDPATCQKSPASEEIAQP